MNDMLVARIEKIIFNDSIAFHIVLDGLSEDEVIQLANLIETEISNCESDFVTIYNYDGFMVTPGSKKKAKELVKFVDSTGRSKGTIAYGADYFVRLLGSIIRPSTKFVTTRSQAIEHMKLMLS